MLKRRLFAYILDWYIGALVTMLPISLVSQRLYGTMKMPIQKFPTQLMIISSILSLFCAFIYYVLVPYKLYSGQTIGKHLCKVKIISTRHERLYFKDIFIRQFICLFFIEGYLISASSLIRQLIVIATKITYMNKIIYVFIGITIFSALLTLFTKEHLALHDYFSHTKVIEIS